MHFHWNRLNHPRMHAFLVNHTQLHAFLVNHTQLHALSLEGYITAALGGIHCCHPPLPCLDYLLPLCRWLMPSLCLPTRAGAWLVYPALRSHVLLTHVCVNSSAACLEQYLGITFAGTSPADVSMVTRGCVLKMYHCGLTVDELKHIFWGGDDVALSPVSPDLSMGVSVLHGLGAICAVGDTLSHYRT
jgi:hypothetical protein